MAPTVITKSTPIFTATTINKDDNENANANANAVGECNSRTEDDERNNESTCTTGKCKNRSISTVARVNISSLDDVSNGIDVDDDVDGKENCNNASIENNNDPGLGNNGDDDRLEVTFYNDENESDKEKETGFMSLYLVTVRNYSDTQRVVVCSCGHYHRHNIPCRRIYAVFNVEPAAFHCGIREQKKFEAFYDKDETTINYTNECNRILALKLKGPVLQLPLIKKNDNDGTSSIPFQQFNSPLQRCCPINPVVVEKEDKEKESEMNEHGF
eukprot:CAMPEP_0170985294 /NCGR_PEP_ID=MMETSP0736-20130129/5391_1 /TAXON_ID=186038 /ORGANISM="Fragilariopsis kerguelensis, Strain L26-C5" /LENGTH=270 /DNA_ID=CAMNT_0011409191 /DNA_START=45 /DNA_END=854 /DNA_ORIENTATION=+